jgi:ubiquinone/menaquinone biosynthesis C-methylase UbiE
MLSWGHAASTGMGFTGATIVDAHFRACEPEYRWALDQAGFRPGSHLLDAGCGAGSFLPWLAEIAGRITAVDLAPEHVTALPPRVDAHLADVTRLPFADNTFDAAWCANTVQYLDDPGLEAALAELRRVVRPNGTIAVKELDPTLITVRPGDPHRFSDFFRTAGGYARQLSRARDLYRWMRRGGLREVRQHTILVERHAPLGEAELAYFAPACEAVKLQAIALGLPGWDDIPDALHDPDGYISEGCTVAIGTV